MAADSSNETTFARIPLIDVLRAVALVAMTIYHFSWDLEFFGWAPPALTLRPEWVWFARCIAASFLFLVGFSLVLAHNGSIRWRAFFNRFAMVAGAAAVISIVTYFAMPGGFIFFGILHAIALFSVLGLVFLPFHWVLSLVVGIAVLVTANMFSAVIFSEPTLWWVGLAPTPPRSNDYVPLFPWFSAVLFGIASAKFMHSTGVLEKLANLTTSIPFRSPLSFIGKHSLIYYLIHQPILMALIWVFTAVAGEPDKTPVFVHQCKIECSRSSVEKFCTPYCACMASSLKKEKLFAPFMNRTLSDDGRTKLYAVRDQCVAAQKPVVSE